MTDKQIIIDGVDVSGCEFATKAEMFLDTHCRLYDYKYCIGKDCHYKNWKRKEQECEELKEKLIKWLGKEGLRQSEKEFYEQQLDQLKADNEELKKIIERLDVPKHEVVDMDIAFENEKLKAENEKLQDIANKLLDERNKYLDKWSINLIYKQTLTEIKEIAEKIDDECEYSCFASCAKKAKKQILRKISEVE